MLNGLTLEYIRTHTPREIANENSMEQINSWASLVSPDFDRSNGTDIFRWYSVGYLADTIMDWYDCAAIVTNEYGYDNHPEADDLLYAFHVLTAQAIKSRTK